MPTQKSPAPASQVINKKYSSLYIDYPKIFLADDAELIEAMTAVSSDDNTS